MSSHVSHASFGNSHVPMPIVSHILGFLEVRELTIMSGVSKALSPRNSAIERIWNCHLAKFYFSHSCYVPISLYQRKISVLVACNILSFLNESEWMKMILLDRSFYMHRFVIKRVLCDRFPDQDQGVVVHHQCHLNEINGYLRKKNSYRICTQLCRLNFSPFDSTLLVRAIQARCVELAEIFIESGVDVDFVSENLTDTGPLLTSALVTAINNRLPKLALQLIGARADPNLTNPVVFSAKQINTIEKQIFGKNCGKHIVDNQESNSIYAIFPLNAAAAHGESEVVSALIKTGVRLDSSDGFLTPLLYATLQGHANIVSTLIDARADVNKMSKYGMTAWMYAKQQKHQEIARMLVQAGATTNFLKLSFKRLQKEGLWSRLGLM